MTISMILHADLSLSLLNAELNIYFRVHWITNDHQLTDLAEILYILVESMTEHNNTICTTESRLKQEVMK